MDVSHSKTKKFQRCRKQYEYSYVYKLKRKGEKRPLYLGSWLHYLLETHYKGGDWREKQAELTSRFMQLFEEEREELGPVPEDAKRMFTSYLMHYGNEDAGIKVLATELDMLVPMRGEDNFRLIIDLIIEEEDGGIWLWDHKNVGRFMPQDYLMLDGQLSRYYWAAKKALPEYRDRLQGVMFNELLTKPPTVPELLKNGKLTERQNLHCDLYTYYREIKRREQDPAMYAATLKRLKSQSERWFRRTRLPKDAPLIKQTMRELVMVTEDMKRAETEKRFPRNPMKSCSFDCDFTDLCMIELMGGDIDSAIRMNYTTKEQREVLD